MCKSLQLLFYYAFDVYPDRSDVLWRFGLSEVIRSQAIDLQAWWNRRLLNRLSLA